MKVFMNLFYMILINTVSILVMAQEELPCHGAKGASHPFGGGFVAQTAYVSNFVYIGPTSQICDTVHISTELGNVRIFNSKISGQVHISGNNGTVLIYNSQIYDNARIEGVTYDPVTTRNIHLNRIRIENSEISGTTMIEDRAEIVESHISGETLICAYSVITNEEVVSGLFCSLTFF